MAPHGSAPTCNMGFGVGGTLISDGSGNGITSEICMGFGME